MRILDPHFGPRYEGADWFYKVTTMNFEGPRPTLRALVGLLSVTACLVSASPILAQTYTEGDLLECSFKTTRGTFLLNWNPQEELLTFGKKTIELRGPVKVSEQAVNIPMVLEGEDADMIYLNERGSATIHLNWKGGGVSLWGPCTVTTP
ncbi:hypothetical protein SAMN06297129_3129 [Pseudooceanicola antarcticus]|uniref:Uncharacterized protein n=2 Tax=Pseudooceanicola antarcticus TaxID=1247613 RepID=A0A285J722_9RHOB|nr:hypothetical protein SAMN06297129_3129 [Pseudooceanicola antarcticus]